MSVFFTADTHFFTSERRGMRESTLRVGMRKFESVAAKTEFLVSRWNSSVACGDEVYILGDFSDGTASETQALLHSLNGKKYLIRGNNDLYLQDASFPGDELFVWVKDYYELEAYGTTFVLFHYPIEVWAGYQKDHVQLHGHTHRKTPMVEPIRRYEVGVDSHDGYPAPLEEVWRAVRPMHNQNRTFVR